MSFSFTRPQLLLINLKYWTYVIYITTILLFACYICDSDIIHLKLSTMARKKSKAKVEKIINEIKNSTPKFKLQLDSRTTITLKTEEQLNKWMQMYPKAELIV